MQKLGGPRRIQHKGEIDLVTDADQESEVLIVAEILRSFPDDRIVAEEGTMRGHDPARRWVIDPLDGTTNFAHGYPFFAVSIALEVAGAVQVGVVYDPLHDELFSAERGAGAQLNGASIEVSAAERVGDSLLCTGFSYDRAEREQALPYLRNVVLAAQGIRRDGAAALDLCYVAAGRLDGFWERGLQPWDLAAGSLIVTEAGGAISTYDGGPHDPWRNEIVATNGLIHAELLAVLGAIS
jgi:myo-inositol-1(or 4)-monophosphatase